ncbi:MAG: DNA-binding protein [Gammaproteobacteria bacterium]|nr:DNA-binding protein [Gammaproteobacteria bacterium]
MKPRVYVETSVVSYLTAQPSRDIVVAGRQEVTREWWAAASSRFELVISQLVREEAGIGDPDAATARLAALAPLVRLTFPREALDLAQRLVDAGAVPRRAAQDAAHVAIAAVHDVEFLVTRNFRHIASATARRRIEAVCRDWGIDPPVLCTPDQLTEAEESER